MHSTANVTNLFNPKKYFTEPPTPPKN